jgi:dienelactone hydrolase
MTTLPCCTGFIDHGEPIGKVISINGIQTYLSEPSQPSKATLVIATDIFGFTLPNVRLIADAFAKQSYRCLIPDLFNGTEPPADLLEDSLAFQTQASPFFSKVKAISRFAWHLPGFLYRNPISKGIQIIKTIIQHASNDGKVFALGYCWGGRIVTILAQDSALPLEAVCAAHPSGLNIPTDIQLLCKSMYIILAEIDMEMKEPERLVIKDTLRQKQVEHPHLFFEYKYYQGMIHGFSVRGCEMDSHVKRQREDAFDTTVSFFNKFIDLH